MPRAQSFKVQPYVPVAGDPLGAEHAAVSAWADEAIRAQDPHQWYHDIDLSALPSGQELLAAAPEKALRLVLAAIAQLCHWDAEAERVRQQATSEIERMNAHHLPGWQAVWGRRRKLALVVSSLMRRAIPFEKDDLIAIMRWCCDGNQPLDTYFAPLGHITRALERYGANHSISADLLHSMRHFATRLRESHNKDAKRFGTKVEQLCATTDGESAETSSNNESSAAPALPTPAPAVAGNPAVLDQLKRCLGVAPVADAPTPDTTPCGPDRFPLRNDSPLRRQHELLSESFEQVLGKSYTDLSLQTRAAGREIMKLSPAARGKVLLAATERHIAAIVGRDDFNDRTHWQSRHAACGTVCTLAELAFKVDDISAWDLLLYLSTRPAHEQATLRHLLEQTLAQLERKLTSAGKSAASPFTEGERYVLFLLRASLIVGPPLGSASQDVARLTKLIGDGAVFFLVPGEAWADAVNADMGRSSADARRRWSALFRHLLTATAPRPSEKWLKAARTLLEGVGARTFARSAMRWLPLVSKPRTIRKLGWYAGDTRNAGDTMHEENATCLRGILWIVPTLPKREDFTRLITSIALSAYKKVPGIGPRAVKVGNASIYTLSALSSPDAVGQLAMLKVRVKFGTAQKEIEKAFTSAAEALSLPRDQIEEMGVPSYGLEEVGIRRETFAGGEFTAQLRVDGREAVISWSRADGKPQKSVPAKVKAEHKEELKELQDSAKDIAAMLPAQAERIDSMFLLQKRWPMHAWRERYLDHPLVGTIARRLIWSFDGAPGAWHEGRLVDVDDTPVTISDDTQVELWHPIGRATHQILAWRRWLALHEVCQPFKQAHREIYVLTDAEQRTRVYSNRFAAHVLRQHQFNALGAARGWKNRLRLLVDDVYPPATRHLPAFGFRAEFWIEGAGDNPGVDTNESGVYLRLTTDQVRFYRIDDQPNYAHAGGGGYTHAPAEPIPLEQIPPLVFSEIMRDVDLFVGVASVGNDPTWQDGGPQGQYRDYWHRYGFGELSATAKTRHEVLESLLPRLKIAARCSLAERFLIVKGNLRTYKIHLGSGSIQMEPNDQYLCIIPARGMAAGSTHHKLFLPFEGDSTLSLILSKAFLLAEDQKITDPTIVSQIKQ